MWTGHLMAVPVCRPHHKVRAVFFVLRESLGAIGNHRKSASQGDERGLRRSHR